MSTVSQQQFPSGYEDLLRSQKYSDLTINCRGRQWRVHRAIICPRSKFFCVLCDGIFQEASSGVVNLDKEDPAILERMLRYLYTMDYSDELEKGENFRATISTSAQGSPVGTSGIATPEDLSIRPFSVGNRKFDLASRRMEESLMINAQVYAMADLIDIPELRQLAQLKFERRMSISDLKIHGPPAAFIEVVRTTADNDKGLREFVLEQCVGVMKWSLYDGNKAYWKRLMREDAHFAAEVLQRTADAYSESLRCQADHYLSVDMLLAAERLKNNNLQKRLDDHKRGIADLVTAINKGTCSQDRLCSAVPKVYGNTYFLTAFSDKIRTGHETRKDSQNVGQRTFERKWRSQTSSSGWLVSRLSGQRLRNHAERSCGVDRSATTVATLHGMEHQSTYAHSAREAGSAKS
ncbi:MAG: hypothetical protein Q9191_002498 [Dirinaria sp. TL-2023a]